MVENGMKGFLVISARFDRKTHQAYWRARAERFYANFFLSNMLCALCVSALLNRTQMNVYNIKNCIDTHHTHIYWQLRWFYISVSRRSFFLLLSFLVFSLQFLMSSFFVFLFFFLQMLLQIFMWIRALEIYSTNTQFCWFCLAFSSVS